MPGLGFVATSFGFYYPESVDAPLDAANLDDQVSTAAAAMPRECPHDDFMGVNDQRYTISSGEHPTTSERPKLNLHFKQESANPDRKYYRVRYGTTGTP